MNTSIHYDRIAGLYAVEMNDQIVGATETYHDAEVLLSSIREAHHSGMIGGDPLLIEAHRFGERGSICAACEDQVQPCAVCRPYCAYAECIQHRTHNDTGFCCYHNEYETGTRCDCEDDDYSDAMAEHAMGTYNGKVPSDFDRPLLTQCAAVIDACLGGPVIGGGILDELRRVRVELKKAGW